MENNKNQPSTQPKNELAVPNSDVDLDVVDHLRLSSTRFDFALRVLEPNCEFHCKTKV